MKGIINEKTDQLSRGWPPTQTLFGPRLHGKLYRCMVAFCILAGIDLKERRGTLKENYSVIAAFFPMKKKKKKKEKKHGTIR